MGETLVPTATYERFALNNSSYDKFHALQTIEKSTKQDEVEPKLKKRKEDPKDQQIDYRQCIGLNKEVEESVRWCRNSEFGLHETELSYAKDIVLHKLGNVKADTKIEDILIAAGFTKEKSRELKIRFDYEDPLVRHESLAFWITLYLEQKWPCFYELPSSPHDDEPNDKWFSVNIEPNNENLKIKCIKKRLASEKEFEVLKKLIYGNEGKFSSKRFWYHGTTWDSAIDICEYGVELCESGKRDFSNSRSFYLTNSFDFAANLAHLKVKHCENEWSAILIFEKTIEKEEMLHLTENWQKVVKHYRCGYEINDALKKSLDATQCLYGQVSTAGDEQTDNFQLCIRKDEMAEAFSRCLKQIVYFKLGPH